MELPGIEEPVQLIPSTHPKRVVLVSRPPWLDLGKGKRKGWVAVNIRRARSNPTRVRILAAAEQAGWRSWGRWAKRVWNKDIVVSPPSLLFMAIRSSPPRPAGESGWRRRRVRSIERLVVFYIFYKRLAEIGLGRRRGLRWKWKWKWANDQVIVRTSSFT